MKHFIFFIYALICLIVISITNFANAEDNPIDAIFEKLCADPGSCEINGAWSILSKGKNVNKGLNKVRIIAKENDKEIDILRVATTRIEQFTPPDINPGAITHAYSCAYTGFATGISLPWGAATLSKGVISANCERINRINMVEGQHFSKSLKARLKLAIFCEDKKNARAMLIAGERCPNLEDAKKYKRKKESPKMKKKNALYYKSIEKAQLINLSFEENEDED